MKDEAKTKTQLINELRTMRQQIVELEALETKWRQTEEALQLSEVRYVLATNSGLVGVWDWNIETNEIYLDPNLKDMLGYADNEISNHIDAWDKLIHPDDLKRIKVARQDHLKGITPHYEFEYRIRHKDGTMRWFLVRGTTMLDFDGNPFRMIGADTDITKRKQIEEALQQQTNRLEALRQVGLELVTELDLDALLKFIASRAAKLVGNDRSGIFLYQPDRDLLELVALSGTSSLMLGATFHSGEGVAGTVWETEKPLIIDNHLQWEEQVASPLAIDLGRSSMIGVPIKWGYEMHGVLTLVAETGHEFSPDDVQMLSLFAAQAAVAIQNARLHEQIQHRTVELEQEITERQRAESALKTYSEQLEEMVKARTRELQMTQEQLIRQERLAVLGQLAGGVGHELRNPLGVISNAVYFLKITLSEADETTQEYLSLINGCVHEAEKIITNLLDFSRGQSSVHKTETALFKLVAEVLERHLPPENVTVTLQINSSLPSVYIDPEQIKQVLINLVINAYQAMPAGGQLTLNTQVKQEQIHLSITDTGSGMSPQVTQKIFEPLFTTKAKGIGLGLAVSKDLVKVNGGSIAVESTENKGSTFIITLPIKETTV